jgi:hypothetical protein
MDKKKRKDTCSYLQFMAWPVAMDDAPPLTKKISLTNETTADLVFNIATEGPFDIVGTTTNAPAHPLSKNATIDTKKTNIATMFNLPPGSFLDILCKLAKPDANNLQFWPQVLKTMLNGKLTFSYANGSIEQLIFEGNLLRPHVTLHIKNSKKNEQAEEEYDFGTVFIGTFIAA